MLKIVGKEVEIMSKSIGAVSLFSGAGGLDAGSFLAGVPVIVSADIESDCIETLKLNESYKNTELLLGDLHDIDSSVFADILKKKKCDRFIVIGGAPCQPFSKNGYWVTHEKRRGINDPRANLINEYLRIVTELRPDGFVFENVESILHPTNKVIVDKFIEIITDAGYVYKIVHANALDYGVPEKRKRLFIVGTKGTFKTEEPKKTHCSPEKVEETGLLPYVTVGDVIGEFDGEEFFEPEEVVKGKYEDELREIPAGKNYNALTEWAGYPNPKFVVNKRFWNFLYKLSPNEASITITAQPGTWIGPFHWENRRLRVPEVAAIQTFPKGYKFFGSRRSIQKQIGNAVPSLMGKAVVEYVKESLE